MVDSLSGKKLKNVFMEKMMTYCVLVLLFGGAALLSCSNNKEAEPEKGMIEKMTDKAAKEMAERIRAPIDQARSAADQEEDSMKDMDKSLKEQQ